MSYYYIKLYIEMLDDYKLMTMPDWMKWRFIQFLLAAREYNHDGLLAPVAQLARRLRIEEDDLVSTLRTMSETGIVAETPDGWLVVNFAKRQARVEGVDRTQQWRERKRAGDNIVTSCHKNSDEPLSQDSSSSSVSPPVSDSPGVRGVGEGAMVNCPALYERNFGALTSMIADELTDLEQTYGALWLSEAMAEAVRMEKRNIKYVAAILKNWQRDGFKAPRERAKPGRLSAEERQAQNMANIKKGLEMAFPEGGQDG